METKARKSTLMTLVIALSIVVVALVVVIAIRGAVASETVSDIGAEKAKRIVLEDAKVDENDVTFTKCALGKDKGVTVYDVEFYTDKTEYDYEVTADTGSIYSRDADPIKIRKRTSNKKKTAPEEKKASGDASKYIGVGRAKRIALSNAGVSASDAYFEKARLDHDDGYAVYDVEFWVGNTEYEYEISAVSGTIVEKSIDSNEYQNSGNGGNSSNNNSSSSSKSKNNNSSNHKHNNNNQYYDDDDDDDYDDDDDDDDDDDRYDHDDDDDDDDDD